jgi:hypothetical protein
LILEGPIDLKKEMLGLKGFGQIAEGSPFHSLHGTFDASIGGEDDHGHLREDEVKLFHQRNSILMDKLQVNDRQVKDLAFNGFYGILLAGRRGHIIICGLQPHLHELQEISVIVDDQDISFRHRSSYLPFFFAQCPKHPFISPSLSFFLRFRYPPASIFQ